MSDERIEVNTPACSKCELPFLECQCGLNIIHMRDVAATGETPPVDKCSECGVRRDNHRYHRFRENGYAKCGNCGTSWNAAIEVCPKCGDVPKFPDAIPAETSRRNRVNLDTEYAVWCATHNVNSFYQKMLWWRDKAVKGTGETPQQPSQEKCPKCESRERGVRNFACDNYFSHPWHSGALSEPPSAKPPNGMIERAILAWRAAPDEMFSVPHLMADFARSELRTSASTERELRDALFTDFAKRVIEIAEKQPLNPQLQAVRGMAQSVLRTESVLARVPQQEEKP